MKKLSPRGMMVASCISFVALGGITAALGPALPDLAANTGSSLAAVGAVITALFVGSLIALIVAGPLNDRIGQRPVLLAGVALLALGTFGVAASHWLPLTLLCAVVAGLGHGAIDVSTNVLIAEVFAARSAAALNLLNVFFGLGAVAGPALASLTLRAWGSALPALWASAGLMLLQAPLIPLLADTPRAPPHPATHTRATRAMHASPLRSPLLWAIGALVLVYVGVENGISGWTTVYLTRTTALDQATAALVTSGFWLALTGGRVAGAIIGARLAPNTLLLFMLSGGLAGGALLAASTSSASLTVAAVLLLGFCLGPIFPTALAIATASFRQAPGTAASMVVALGSVGGTLLPWLQGVVLERAGPAASVLLVAACTLAMLGLQLGRGLLGQRGMVPREEIGREVV
ncbi:MAG: MFS transporter [Roseiflexaceae bacterium]